MIPQDIICAKNCRNTCTMLEEAMREETTLVRFYERVLAQCQTPELQTLFREILEERSGAILKMMRQLNEIQARAQIQDGILASFRQPKP
jgi:rubrerythrin